VSGEDLARALRVLGYSVTRQTGSHLRLTTQQQGEHHVTIPRHGALRVGTLAAVLTDVAPRCTPLAFTWSSRARPPGRGLCVIASQLFA
jgi:predicted RNA binding protein YcfA (HicA-like mRNA interferase family)